MSDSSILMEAAIHCLDIICATRMEFGERDAEAKNDHVIRSLLPGAGRPPINDRSSRLRRAFGPERDQGVSMNNIIYLIGLVVVVMAVLAFVGLR